MISLISYFLLFIAAVSVVVTYLVIPRLPVVALVSASAIALAAGVWWHWVQFASEYRISTWQEQLRNYGSYVLVLVVILGSYAFYAFGWSGSSIQSYVSTAVRQISPKTNIATSVTNAISSVFEDEDEDGEGMDDVSDSNEGDEEYAGVDDGVGVGVGVGNEQGLLADLMAPVLNTGNANRNRGNANRGNANKGNANKGTTNKGNANRGNRNQL